MTTMFKMKTKKCGLCGGKRLKGSGIMQYRATDNDGRHQMFSMAICKLCCDDIDNQQQKAKPQEVRDWIMRK